MENLIKGWALSAIGFIGVVLISLHWSGVYEFPNPDFLETTGEIIIGLIFCFALFIFPKTKIEVYLEKLVKSIVGLFNKKK